jgi:hypothetical protein
MRRTEGGRQGQAVLNQTDVNIRKLSLAVESHDVEQQTVLSFRIDVCNQSLQTANDLVVRALVQDPNGTVLSPEQSKLLTQLNCLPAGVDCQVFLSLEIENPILWTQEMPDLYQVRLIMEDHQGRVLDTLVQSFGIQQFRSGHYGVKQAGQNIAMEPSDEEAGTFLIANQFDYISLDRFEPHWELQEDGTTIAQGKLAPMSVLPGQAIKMSLPMDGIHCKATAHYEWIMSFRPITNTLWAPADQSVTSGRLRLQ